MTRNFARSYFIEMPEFQIAFCDDCNDECRFQRPDSTSVWFCANCGSVLGA